MTRKRIISLMLCIMVLTAFISMFTGCSVSDKIPIPTVKKDVYIYDEDNIIDDNVETSLNSLLVQLEQKTETEFAVISIQSLGIRSIENYANNLFNTLGIGKKGKDNGVLLLISRSDKKVRLEVGRGLEGAINDSKAGRILDTYFVPYRESGEYTKATELTVKAVVAEIAEEYSVEIDGVSKEELAEETDKMSSSTILLIIVVVVIIAIIILAVVFGVDPFDGSSSGGYFGGSSGGFSGGGGFGGGFSGGGGASR